MFPRTDFSLKIESDSFTTARMGSEVSAMNRSDAHSAVRVSVESEGFPRSNLGLQVDSGSFTSRESSEEAAVMRSESDLSVR